MLFRNKNCEFITLNSIDMGYVFNDRKQARLFNSSTGFNTFGRNNHHQSTKNGNFSSSSWNQVVFRRLGSIWGPPKQQTIKLLFQEDIERYNDL